MRDNAMTSDQWSVSLPSPLDLFDHPRCCATIPGLVQPSPAPREPERQDVATPTAMHLTTFRQPHPQVSVRTATKWEVPTQPPSKPLLGTGHAMTPDGSKIRHDSHQLHDAVRHTATRN
jgi:hypothetical protein